MDWIWAKIAFHYSWMVPYLVLVTSSTTLWKGSSIRVEVWTTTSLILDTLVLPSPEVSTTLTDCTWVLASISSWVSVLKTVWTGWTSSTEWAGDSVSVTFSCCNDKQNLKKLDRYLGHFFVKCLPDWLSVSVDTVLNVTMSNKDIVCIHAYFTIHDKNKIQHVFTCYQ